MAGNLFLAPKLDDQPITQKHNLPSHGHYGTIPYVTKVILRLTIDIHRESDHAHKQHTYTIIIDLLHARA